MSDEIDDVDVVDVDYIEPEPAARRTVAAGDEVLLDEPAVIDEVRWEEQAVTEHLEMVGGIVHELWGKAETDWVMSERDLQRIGPPLTRILNRYEPTARAAIASDPILLGYGTTMYAYRSILQARAAVAEEREQQERPPDAAGYEPIQSQGQSGENGRPDRQNLRFPEASRGAANEGD